MDVLNVRGLCKTYPDFKLDNVSFSVESGRIVGFIGRNGAGKTTTIKSMLNLVHPESGEIKFFGLELSDNESAIKKRIGYSTGAVNYYPKKKLSRILAIAKDFYGNWDAEACERFRKLFKLDLDKTPSQLSEGMRVKFNLLLALSHNAEIVILDEPTSGLDPFSRDELLEIFRLLKDSGTAIFFSTHIISDLEKCADDIVYIHEGKITAALPKAEFSEKYGISGESLEDTMLRMERSCAHE